VTRMLEAFEAWRDQRERCERCGRRMTLIGLYALVAETRGLQAAELPLTERRMLWELASPVITPGIELIGGSDPTSSPDRVLAPQRRRRSRSLQPHQRTRSRHDTRSVGTVGLGFFGGALAGGRWRFAGHR